MTIRGKVTFAATVLTASAVGMTLFVAIPANADSTDSQFLSNLHEINDPSIVTLADAAPDLVTTPGRNGVDP
jgi:hypothetical protein